MQALRMNIDGIEVEARQGEKILDVASRNGIFIPHLCNEPTLDDAFAGCRLCLVEVEGRPRPVTSCTEIVRDGMVVRTNTESIRRLQRSALRLLISDHHVDCKRCYANRRCRLQDLARELSVKLKVKGLRDLSRRDPIDRTLGSVFHDANKCVLCGRCVRRSHNEGMGRFHFSGRGLGTRIVSFPGDEAPELLKWCLDVCPVGALIPPDAIEQIQSVMETSDDR
jgi:NADH dehydrogenase/NADH:ubiquinone oxidoreductase subunit G